MLFCVQVDAMRQKAFIEVTEEGTEAAAVTIAAIGLRYYGHAVFTEFVMT